MQETVINLVASTEDSGLQSKYVLDNVMLKFLNLNRKVLFF